MTEETKTEEQTVENTNIANPLIPQVDVPMCIVSSGTERFIGGIIELDGGLSNCTLAFPLRYAEFYRPTSDGKTHIEMIMEKVYAYVGFIREFAVKYDTIYFFHPDNKEDEMLVQLYFERHQAIKKRDAGMIEIKEPSRIIIPGMNDISTCNNTKVR